MAVSDDPLIQWCVDEALDARVRVAEHRQAARQQAVSEAQRRAQAQLKAAI